MTTHHLTGSFELWLSGKLVGTIHSDPPAPDLLASPGEYVGWTMVPAAFTVPFVYTGGRVPSPRPRPRPCAVRKRRQKAQRLARRATRRAARQH